MRKKEILAEVLALLILSGCGGQAASPPPGPMMAHGQEPPPAAQETALPETEALEPLTAPAVVTEGRPPAERYDLPVGRDYHANMMNWAGGNGEPIALLAEDPGADAAFYGVEWDTALIRWGTSQAEFDWPYATPRQFLPELYCFDLDGDREDELVVLCYSGSGTGVSIYDLHVVEKDPDGALTGYTLPRNVFSQLSERISIFTSGKRTYAILGTELVDLTEYLLEREGADIQGLALGDIVYYDVDPGPAEGHDIRLLASAWAESDHFPPTAAYMADLDAMVSYGDGSFTLSQIHLNRNE